MFSKFALFITSALALTAVAAPGGPISPGSCNSGDVQCCNSVHSDSSDIGQTLLGLLGIAVGAIQGDVGVQCNPITVIGAGGVNCASQPVCCENNNFNGLINVGCTPINVNA